MPGYIQEYLIVLELFGIFQNVLFISYGLMGIVFISWEYNVTHIKIVIEGFRQLAGTAT